MEMKFQKKINDFNKILSFDLAKRKTGWSLISIKNKLILDCGVIETSEVNPWESLYSAFSEIIEKYAINGELTLITKERLPNQAGRYTTINSLQELAKVHAIFDLCCQTHNSLIYDFDGVHSKSVKSHFEKLTNITNPTKEDIANVINLEYENVIGKDMNLDITDSIAVSITLLDHKWNSDIDKQISELKKEIKKYKTEKKKNELLSEIDRIQMLKVD